MKKSVKSSGFLIFYLYLCNVIDEFCIYSICSTKVCEISEMTPSATNTVVMDVIGGK